MPEQHEQNPLNEGEIELPEFWWVSLEYSDERFQLKQLNPNTKVSWKCLFCNHVWMEKLSDRYDYENPAGCKVCFLEKNSLAVTDPEVAEQLHPTKNRVKANDVTADSTVNAWWKCRNTKCNHSWHETVASMVQKCRTKKTGGCLYCSLREKRRKNLKKMD